MGRPSKLTPARARAILAMIADGVFIETACRAAGVDSSTYRRWLKLADDPNADPIYARFRDAADIAHAKSEVDDVRVVKRASKTDARHSEWRLERSYPARYGRLTKTEVTGKDGGPVQVVPIISLKNLHAVDSGTHELTDVGRASLDVLDRFMDPDDVATRRPA